MRWRWAVLVAAVLAVTGCAGPAKDDPLGRIRVVAGFYPLQFVAEQIGGDRVVVDNLTRAGAEPHDLELRPSQLAAVEDADLVVYLRGFQPAVDEAVALQRGGKAFDVGGVEALRDGDPHVWLDPVRLAGIADAL